MSGKWKIGDTIQGRHGICDTKRDGMGIVFLFCFGDTPIKPDTRSILLMTSYMPSGTASSSPCSGSSSFERYYIKPGFN